MDEIVCPECVQGKHVNCTSWALNANDEMTECECADSAHPWNKES